MKKERPILYSTPMVQSLLDDIKKMTRRINGLAKVNSNPEDWEYVRFYDGYAKFCENHNHINELYLKCPYGKVGDILWVRETWNERSEHAISLGFEKFFYKAGWIGCTEKGWKPSIFMPKDACRIRLEITDIRVERLQDISEEDAKNEGAYRGILRDGPNTEKGQFHLEFNVHGYYKTGFEFIWKVINGKESWNANPWVWVILFKKL